MIGERAERVEDYRFLRGEGEFVADRRLPGMLEAFIVRSPHASATIRSIQAEGALSCEGVVDILTAADLSPNLMPIPCRVKPKSDLTPFLQPVLARDRVRYVGEPVAVIVAHSRALAEDAAERLEIDWDTTRPVADTEAALRCDAPKLHNEGNIASRWSYDLGDVDAAFRQAAVVVEETFRTQRQTGAPLETRGLLARYDRRHRRLEVFGPTKIPHTNRRLLAGMWELSEPQIHFIEPDVGGSFGVRGEIYPEDFLIPYMAVRLSAPIRWIEDRLEHFSAINHSRQAVIDVRAAADRQGCLLAFDIRLSVDMGAYMRTHGDIVPSYISGGFCGPYRVRNYRAEVAAVLTNKSPTGTIRSPGTFEANFARERTVDIIAERLGLQADEVRRRNLLRPHELPWRLNTSTSGHETTFDAGDYPAVFERAIADSSLDPIAKSDQQVLRGRGVATMVEPSALGVFESARVEVESNGQLGVFSGCTSQGQGQETTLAQVVAEVFQVPLTQVTVKHGDTDLIRFGGGTNASRAAVMAGNAVYAAAELVRKQAAKIAASRLETEERDIVVRAGRFEIEGVPGSGYSLGEIALLVQPGNRHSMPSPESALASDNEGLVGTSHIRGVPYGTSVFATHVADVAIDRQTGVVSVERYYVACDIGRAINPMIVEGQIVGGVVQGIGGALLEELVYDEEGQLKTASLADYLLPTVAEAPPVKVAVLELTRSQSNPLGLRGVGEVGPAAVGAAIGNAVARALGGGGDINQLPLTPERILNVMRDKNLI
jgi:CO/xanthine dehydrogenase Mo-binding subunit